MGDHKNLKRKIQVSPSSRITLLAMACVLMLPLVWGIFFTSSQQRSQFENRTLAKFPPLPLIKTPKHYGEALDNYFKDHMGFTTQINQWYRKFVFYTLHESTVKNISLGRDDFVFLTSHESTDYNRVFDDLCQEKVSTTQLDNLS